MVKIVDHDERRHAIANAAVSVIAEMGIEQAKLRVIAARAGVTTGAISHYFSGKDAVLEAALTTVATALFHGKRDTKEAKDGGETRPLKYIEVLPTNEANQRYWRVWLAFCGHASYSDSIRAMYSAFYKNIEDAVAVNLGIDDKVRAKEVAACIIAAVDGVGLCATVQPNRWPPARQKARLTELLSPFFD